MVVPSPLPSARKAQSTTIRSNGTKPFPQSQHNTRDGNDQASFSETRESESSYGGKDDSWFKFFFGQSEQDEETRQKHNDNKTSSVAEDANGDQSDDHALHIKTMEENQKNGSDGRYLSWLSWLDPEAGCAADGPPAISEILAGEEGNLESGKADQEKDIVQKRPNQTQGRRPSSDPPAKELEETLSVDSSIEESKVFGDLASVGSTKVETIAGSIKTTDLDLQDGESTTMASVTESLVGNKLENLGTPRNKKGKAKSSSNASRQQHEKIDTKKSLDARRQILVNELRSTIATHGRYDVKTANISAALGDLLEESKQYEQSVKLHQDAVEIYSSKLGDDNPTTMEAKLNLAKVLESAKKYDDAINIYFLVTMMRRAIHGETDPSSADSLVLMANALRKKGDFHQAIKELKRSLKIYREALGDSHSKVSTTVDEIASLYVTIGDFEKSAAILEEVVKLKSVTQGAQSRAVATTLESLATTYECSEEFTKAMKSLKKAYKIYTDLEGYSCKDATNTLNRIGQLYEATGDYDRASIAYLGVLRGKKMHLGDDHLEVAATYYKLGHALRESGQHDKALKCLKEGLPIFVNKGVELHDVEMIAEVMHEMALINKERKKFNEAARILKQELGVRRKIGQADYPMIARTLNHLGVTEYEMKNYNRSLKYLVDALTIFKGKAEGSVECAEVLFNTGLVFESSRNKERAMEAYDEAARIFKEHGYEDTHPHLAKALRKIEKLQH